MGLNWPIALLVEYGVHTVPSVVIAHTGFLIEVTVLPSRWYGYGEKRRTKSRIINVLTQVLYGLFFFRIISIQWQAQFKEHAGLHGHLESKVIHIRVVGHSAQTTAVVDLYFGDEFLGSHGLVTTGDHSPVSLFRTSA